MGRLGELWHVTFHHVSVLRGGNGCVMIDCDHFTRQGSRLRSRFCSPDENAESSAVSGREYPIGFLFPSAST